MTGMDAIISRCEVIINYTFKDNMLCVEALNSVQGSYQLNGTSVDVRDNDRLALLGSTTMKHELCRGWYVFRLTRSKSLRAVLTAQILIDS
jgi:hypothetical protein